MAYWVSSLLPTSVLGGFLESTQSVSAPEGWALIIIAPLQTEKKYLGLVWMGFGIVFLLL